MVGGASEMRASKHDLLQLLRERFPPTPSSARSGSVSAEPSSLTLSTAALRLSFSPCRWPGATLAGGACRRMLVGAEMSSVDFCHLHQGPSARGVGSLQRWTLADRSLSSGGLGGPAGPYFPVPAWNWPAASSHAIGARCPGARLTCVHFLIV